MYILLIICLVLNTYSICGNLRNFRYLDEGKRTDYEQTCLLSGTIGMLIFSVGALVGTIYGFFNELSTGAVILLIQHTAMAYIGIYIPRCTYHEFVDSNPSDMQKYLYYGSYGAFFVVAVVGYAYVIKMYV